MKDTSKAKNNKKKTYIVLMICIMVIITIAVIAVINLNKKEPQVEEKINNGYEFPSNQIDMENTINAEIVDAEKRNTSEKLLQERTYNDMQIKDIRLTATKNVSQFMATVKSELDKPVEGEIIYVVFIRKDGTEIAKIETYFPDMEPNGEGTIYLSSELDIANAYDFYITK